MGQDPDLGQDVCMGHDPNIGAGPRMEQNRSIGHDPCMGEDPGVGQEGSASPSSPMGCRSTRAVHAAEAPSSTRDVEKLLGCLINTAAVVFVLCITCKACWLLFRMR